MLGRLARWTAGPLCVGGGLLGAVLAGGTFVPEGHVAASRASYQQPPEAVWEAVTSFEQAATWRPDVLRVERRVGRDGRQVFVDVGEHCELPYEVTELEPPSRLVLRVADPELPISGSWTFVIEPDPSGSTLTIVEDVRIESPVRRFMSHFVFGHHRTMDVYLTALGAKFDEGVEVEHVF